MGLQVNSFAQRALPVMFFSDLSPISISSQPGGRIRHGNFVTFRPLEGQLLGAPNNVIHPCRLVNATGAARRGGDMSAGDLALHRSTALMAAMCNVLQGHIHS
jgi:hypothetical protein